MYMKNITKNYQIEFAVLKLVNKFFWKSKVGPIAVFFLPLFFMILSKIISMNPDFGGVSIFADGLSAYISFAVLPICLICIPQLLIDIKKSILLRKISTSKITKSRYCFIVVSYFLLVNIAATFIIFALYALFLLDYAGAYFNRIPWGDLIFSLLYLYISFILFGFLLGSIFKVDASIQIIGFAIIFISLIFAGQFIPIQVIYASEPIKYISLILPLNYPMALMNISLVQPPILYASDFPNIEMMNFINESIQGTDFGASVFQLSQDFMIVDLPNTLQSLPDTGPLEGFKMIKLTIYYSWMKILFISLPPLFWGGASYIIIKKFSWLSR